MKLRKLLPPGVAAAVLLLAHPVPLPAQQAQEPSGQATAIDAPSIEKLQAQFSQIEISVQEFDRLDAMLADAPPAYEPLLKRRLYEIQKAVFQQVDSVSGDIPQLEAEGVDVGEFRAQAIAWLQDLAEFSRDFLRGSTGSVAGLLEQRQTASAADVVSVAFELDQKISRNVEAYLNLHQTLVRLDAFGVDVTDELADITTRIREAAEMLAVAIQVDGDEMQKYRYRLTLNPDDSDAKVLLRVAELGRQSYARNLGQLSNLLEQVGVNPSSYRSLVLVVTGDVASQILDTGVMSSLAKEWSISAWDWTKDNGLGWAIKLIVFMLILLIFRALARVTRRLVERGVTRVNLSLLLRKMIVASAGNAVMILGILIALSQMGISIGPLLAGLGVLGFIVGFALQDTLGNFASGMMILVYRPYDVGDIIEAGGVSGKVTDMSLVYTAIHTFDNQRMVVPNNKIWGDVIRNVTSQNMRRVDLVFGISYEDDIEKAEKVLQAIVDENEKTLDEPEPVIKVHTLNDSSVDFVVRPWARSEDYWDVYWDITREVKLRFDKEGISIPFPQRDVHVMNSPSPA